MLLSPTENQLRKLLPQAHTSTVPETHGADILFATRMGLIGVQRKEVQDLIASVIDGRLSKELAQMKSLDVGILLIEGRQLWSGDNLMLGIKTRWTKAQQLGVELSAQLKGVWIVKSESLQGTIQLLSMLEDWASTDRSLLSTRTGPVSPWGHKTNRDWLYHLIQGIEGVGPKLAKVIVDKFGCPFKWVDEITPLTLTTLEGIGSVKAASIYNSLS
jgi:ERCC4-type nuclease